MAKYVMALDQGTTSSRAIIFNREQQIVAVEQKEYAQIYPHEGWVEHDPLEIYGSQYAVMTELLSNNNVAPNEIAAIGITNQRETTILWEKSTGQPIYNAIVWQCRRTAHIVDDLVKKQGLGEYIIQTTGLIPDAYFSATKIKWILDHVAGARERARKGEILFGTVDTWLIWNLSGKTAHVTDYTNASRTMLFDIHKLDWDQKLLDALDIPREILPEVKPSSAVYANALVEGYEIPIAGNAGDQQAALFGQCCFEKGEAKNTYGTGCFLLVNSGETVPQSKNGLLTTIAASLPGKVQYALEGSAFVGGAVIQWLRDELRLIEESPDSEYFAEKTPDSGGVYLVPAFAGLGAPYWDMYARGCIMGITRGTKRRHIIRAAEESIAYQVMDLIKAMEKDLGTTISALKVDGGAARDKFLMQFQSDISACEIIRPIVKETTALGAACLAGLAIGFWKDLSELKSCWQSAAVFKPAMENAQREKLVSGWHKAVDRSRNWAE